MKGNDHEYDDIIDHEHYVSKTRRPMSMENRAAQFSAFAALTGFEDAISDAGDRYEEGVFEAGKNIPVEDAP